MKVEMKNQEDVRKLVKRMVYLAYEACGGALGMGIFQEACLGGQKATEEEVWEAAYNETDYPAKITRNINSVHCDYVIGRMIKWGCSWEGNIITIRDSEFNPEYQGFCRTYPSNEILVKAAKDSLGL